MRHFLYLILKGGVLMSKRKPTLFAKVLSSYFFDYLPVQKGLSPNTIQSYQDSIAVFLEYCETECHLKREHLEVEMLTRQLIESFLEWLETEKHNSVATRNQRKTALSSFFKYLQYEQPQYVFLYQQISGIPRKSSEKQIVQHISVDAVKKILEQPNLKTRQGRRDFAILSFMYESAARVSELTGVQICDIDLTKGKGVVHLRGKGRKFRDVPIVSPLTEILKSYLTEERRYRQCNLSDPLFVNRDQQKLTRSGIFYIFKKHAQTAQRFAPELFSNSVHPHVFRHSRAMHWLESGVDLQYIKDLLGHTDLKTTEIYAQLNVEMKRKILETAHPQTEKNPLQSSWANDKKLMLWLQGFNKP